MKRTIPALFLIFSFALITAAQTSSRVEKEILAVRQTVAEAIAKNDRAVLAAIFADDFVHTHAVGRVDDKERRLDGLLDGGANLESVAPSEIRVRSFGKNTAVANGRTKIAADDGEITYQWTAVYVKLRGKWCVAASQATRVSPEK